MLYDISTNVYSRTLFLLWVTNCEKNATNSAHFVEYIDPVVIGSCAAYRVEQASTEGIFATLCIHSQHFFHIHHAWSARPAKEIGDQIFKFNSWRRATRISHSRAAKQRGITRYRYRGIASRSLIESNHFPKFVTSSYSYSPSHFIVGPLVPVHHLPTMRPKPVPGLD